MSERDRRGDRDPPRKTWRELDANRDRARTSSSPPGDRRPPREEERASKQHRAALEAMFAKGEVGKLIAEKLAPPAPTPRAAVPVAPAGPPPPAPPPDPNSRASLRKKVLDAMGRDEITRAVDKFVDKHGMPTDFELLEQALEHSREERVAEVLATLERMLEKEKPKRSRALAGKLRFLEETSHDAELRGRAAQIRSKLG